MEEQERRFVPEADPGVETGLVDVAAAWAVGVDTSILSSQERSRAAQFIREEDRIRYLVAHVALRQHLAHRLGTEPGALEFGRGPCPGCGAPHGRPLLTGRQAEHRDALHFSLSHGGGQVLVASAPVPIGADVEAIPGQRTVEEIAPQLHVAEQAELAATPRQERLALFARIWTRKEAYLKGLGIGLARRLDVDYTGPGLHRPGPVGWRITELPAPPGHAAALAVASG